MAQIRVGLLTDEPDEIYRAEEFVLSGDQAGSSSTSKGVVICLLI